MPEALSSSISSIFKDKLKTTIYFSTKFMVTKADMVVAYDEGNSPMISHDPLTTWLREITL